MQDDDFSLFKNEIRGVKPIKHERAATQAAGLGLNQCKYGLHGNCCIYCRAALAQHLLASLRAQRVTACRIPGRGRNPAHNNPPCGSGLARDSGGAV